MATGHAIRRNSVVRVSCTVSASGSTYRIYRSDDDFVAQMKKLIPYLHAAGFAVLALAAALVRSAQ